MLPADDPSPCHQRRRLFERHRVHVTTTLGEEECDTDTLVNDLALQQHATAAAVEVLNCLTI
ncbi:hypothetical protein E4N62_45205 [Streptomyces sp. MNU76]|uniref:hypothetical protein n=1 Tax=Streptomyces sp. MNU76 TaxID=2560026 RepID=UPI001E44187E|nr:hypothetical protein [Streptomyces sp. MNU76]MCC9711786.1 hypothetical protein [Streptomyces sp. MNU76]